MSTNNPNPVYQFLYTLFPQVGNFLDNLFELISSILNLNFVIPDEIYQGLKWLCSCAGYIIPFSLYQPIIFLILSYYFILILAKCFKAISSLISSIIGRFI